jgi:hypothetical protein
LSPLKRNIVHSVLVVLALWPMLHIVMVERYDLNAWKFAGWGMYSAPQFPARVQLLCHTSDEVGLYELRTIQPAVEPEFRRFLRLRHGLRGLVEPDALARALLDHYSAIDGVDIVVVQPVLDRRTGMIEEKATTYRYRRSASPQNLTM